MVSNVTLAREVIKGKLTHWEGEVASVVLTQVRGVAFRLRDLLQLALRSRGATEVVQTTNHSQHGSQGDDTGFLAQGGLRSHTEGDVAVLRSVQADLLGLGEDLGVVVGSGLRIG